MKNAGIQTCTRRLSRVRSTIGTIWRLFALLIAFAVAGCGTPDPRVMNTKLPAADSIGGSGKAIVILSAAHRFETHILKNQSGALDLVFATRRPINVVEQGKPVMKRFVTFNNRGRARAIALEPGAYSLISLSHFVGGNFRYRTAGWNRKTGRPTVFGFSVSAGEVVYLGHLVTSRSSPGTPLLLKVDNKPSEAKKALKVGYPGQAAEGLIKRMQTRLLDVPKTAW